jgi:SAM-dependent methyltransferase
MTRSEMDPDAWGEQYSRRATEFEVSACGDFHRELVVAVEAGASLSDKPILEVGPGSGAFTVFFSRRGHRITSVDFCEDIVVMVRELVQRAVAGGSVTIELANAFDLPFDDRQFSVVFSQGLLEHYQDDEILALIEEQRRVSDMVVFSVPLETFVNNPMPGERRMTLEEWKRVLAPLVRDGMWMTSYWNGWMGLGIVPGRRSESEDSNVGAGDEIVVVRMNDESSVDSSQS